MIIYYAANYQCVETIIVSFKKRGASDLGRVARAHFSFSSPLQIDGSRASTRTTEMPNPQQKEDEYNDADDETDERNEDVMIRHSRRLADNEDNVLAEYGVDEDSGDDENGSDDDYPTT
jgi:hypothetical protein